MDSKALETKDLENGDVASDPPPAPDESGNSTVSSATATKDPSEELPGLPLLNYRLMEHKKKLFLVGGMLLLEGSILPIVLYYPLWFDTTLRHGIRKY